MESQNIIYLTLNEQKSFVHDHDWKNIADSHCHDINNNQCNIVGETQNNQHISRRNKFNEFETGEIGSEKSGIYSLDINKMQWKKVSITMPKPERVNFGITSALNNKYVILFGGYSGCFHDDIFIFSLSTHTLTKSRVKCPERGVFEAMTMNNNKDNDLIVDGYIR